MLFKQCKKRLIFCLRNLESRYVFQGIMRVNHGALMPIVITSYSIHYTKLYEPSVRSDGSGTSSQSSASG